MPTQPSSRIAELAPDVQTRLASYRDLLVRWNQRFNLTAISEPEAIDRRLIGDALRMLPAVDAACADIGGQIRLVDVGTGAGFPGMVLKIARPALRVTLIEATGKKVTFLQEVIRDLRLDDIRALHGRAEEFGHDLDHRNQYDIATARAVASLPALLELTMPLLRVGGVALFPKGADIDEELEMGRSAAQTLGARILSSDALPELPDEGVTRLVRAAKIRPTPDRYPRRSGMPAREPLGRPTP